MKMGNTRADCPRAFHGFAALDDERFVQGAAAFHGKAALCKICFASSKVSKNNGKCMENMLK